MAKLSDVSVSLSVRLGPSVTRARCGKMAGAIEMTLCMLVGIGPSDIVLDQGLPFHRP